MPRKTPISFRSAEIDRELDRRYASRHQGAKRDLLDYYEWSAAMLRAMPQGKLYGAQWIYHHWLAGRLTAKREPAQFGYHLACQRLREAHPGTDPFALTQADYEAAGFRIL